MVVLDIFLQKNEWTVQSQGTCQGLQFQLIFLLFALQEPNQMGEQLLLEELQCACPPPTTTVAAT